MKSAQAGMPHHLYLVPNGEMGTKNIRGKYKRRTEEEHLRILDELAATERIGDKNEILKNYGMSGALPGLCGMEYRDVYDIVDDKDTMHNWSSGIVSDLLRLVYTVMTEGQVRQHIVVNL